MQNKRHMPVVESRVTGQDIERADIGKYWFSSMSIDEIPGMPGFQNAFKTGLYDFKSYIADNDIQLTGSRKAGIATTANPMYLSKNFLYSYSYAYTAQNRSPESTYIGIFEVKDTKELFDLTEPDDFVELFGEKYTKNPIFYELFRKAELYFSWNSNITAFDKIALQLIEYQIARVVIMWRLLKSGVDLGKNQDGDQLTLDNLFQPFSKIPADVNNQKNLETLVKKHYAEFTKKIRFLDLMFLDNIPDKCFSDLKRDEYQEIWAAYDKQVFEPSYKLDPTNKYGDGYLHDEKNPKVIVKRRYSELPSAEKKNAVKKNWPVSRDDSIGYHKEKGSEINQKIIFKEFPFELSDSALRIVNAYLKLTYEVRKVIKDAAVSQNQI